MAEVTVCIHGRQNSCTDYGPYQLLRKEYVVDKAHIIFII